MYIATENKFDSSSSSGIDIHLFGATGNDSVLFPRDAGPLGRWAAGPLGRWVGISVVLP
jgi:hypothetical protein